MHGVYRGVRRLEVVKADKAKALGNACSRTGVVVSARGAQKVQHGDSFHIQAS